MRNELDSRSDLSGALLMMEEGQQLLISREGGSFTFTSTVEKERASPHATCFIRAETLAFSAADRGFEVARETILELKHLLRARFLKG